MNTVAPPIPTEIPPAKERVRYLDDPTLVEARGYGRGRTPGEALWSCVVAITGYPYRGSGLDSALARRLDLTPQHWSGLKADGGVHGTLPVVHRLGLVFVSLSEDDHIVCHPSWLSRAGDWPRPVVTARKFGGADAR